MKLHIANRPQFFAGLVFTAIGIAALVMAREYPLGNAARVGPGYFPLLLSILLTGLGIAACVTSLGAGPIEHIGRWALVPMVFVLLGVVGFGLVIDKWGFIVAALCPLLLGCYQRILTRPIELAVLSAGLIGFTILLFVKFLGMPIAIY